MTTDGDTYSSMILASERDGTVYVGVTNDLSAASGAPGRPDRGFTSDMATVALAAPGSLLVHAKYGSAMTASPSAGMTVERNSNVG